MSKGAVESVSEVKSPKNRRRKYRVTEKFCDLLKAKELEVSSVSKTEYFGTWYDCIIGVGPDHTATLKMPEETILANPECFKEVDGGEEPELPPEEEIEDAGTSEEETE
jgi:hypothetical protein